MGRSRALGLCGRPQRALHVEPVLGVGPRGGTCSGAALLQLNGVRCLTESTTKRLSTRSVVALRIHAVDLCTVAIRRLIGDREMPVRNLSRAGARAGRPWRAGPCALGLHFGAVDVVVAATGRPFVRRVDPSPSCDDELARLYGVELARSLRTLAVDAAEPPRSRASRLLLGADPEFVIVRRDNRTLRCASDLFPMDGSVGYDRQRTMLHGRHCHPIAEIRPSPSGSPYALVEHVRTELKKAYRLAPDMIADWLAGAHPAPGCFTG